MFTGDPRGQERPALGQFGEVDGSALNLARIGELKSMALTIDQLRNGINYWHKKQPKWDQDFHNDYYEHKLPPVPPNGVFNNEWWDRFYPVLQDWQATRRGGGRAFLTARAQARFDELGERWASAVAPHLDNDIAGLEWHQIAAFPLLVAEIKLLKSPSPVFTAKFCHFLAPRIFPVTDNKALRNPFLTYEECFKAARAEWLGTDVAIQDELVALLTNEIGAPFFGGFPMKCKLIEICMIGRCHRD